MVQRVAVVGAGASGLCAARHILSRPGSFAPPVVFELSDSVGGTWCYEERTGPLPDGRPVLSSMYRDLRWVHLSGGGAAFWCSESGGVSDFRTNLPKEVMMFPDFPFDPQLSSFLPHQEVQRYLDRYCDNFHIRTHIRVSPRPSRPPVGFLNS